MAMKLLTAEQKQALAALRTSLGGISEEKRASAEASAGRAKVDS